jgi:hypothetical protein
VVRGLRDSCRASLLSAEQIVAFWKRGNFFRNAAHSRVSQCSAAALGSGVIPRKRIGQSTDAARPTASDLLQANTRGH